MAVDMGQDDSSRADEVFLFLQSLCCAGRNNSGKRETLGFSSDF